MAARRFQEILLATLLSAGPQISFRDNAWSDMDVVEEPFSQARPQSYFTMTDEVVRAQRTDTLAEPVPEAVRDTGPAPDTAGKDWYHMGRPRMTPQLELDLRALQLRKAADSEREGDAPSERALPKYFAVGHFVEGNDGPGTGRRRKRSNRGMVDEMLKEKGVFVDKAYRKAIRRRDYHKKGDRMGPSERKRKRTQQREQDLKRRKKH